MNASHTPTESRSRIRLSTIGRMLLIATIASFFAYFFFLIQTVQAVGERKDLHRQSEEIQSEVAALEITYYEKVHAFGLSTLEDFGYQNTRPRFVMLDGTTTEESLARVQ